MVMVVMVMSGGERVFCDVVEDGHVMVVVVVVQEMRDAASSWELELDNSAFSSSTDNDRRLQFRGVRGCKTLRYVNSVCCEAEEVAMVAKINMAVISVTVSVNEMQTLFSCLFLRQCVTL